MENSPSQVNVDVLRKVLQRFNDDYGQEKNESDRNRLGKILTVVDASIADPDQRKAVKDLIQNDWWGNTYPSFNVHSELRKLTETLGFELYPKDATGPVLGQALSKDTFNRYDALVKDK